MATYRVSTHGKFDTWFQVEKKVLGFWWVPVAKYINSKALAYEDIECRLNEISDNKE